MDLDTITIADFKAQFARDFPYLVVWSNTTTYNTGKEVYYDINELFYRSLIDGNVGLIPPDNPSEWEQYSDDIYNYVLDADITKAFAEAQLNFNQALFGSDSEITLVYLYLTAHYLVMDIRGALQGLESSGTFNVSSRSVGSVSESYAIPQEYLSDPFFEYFTKTTYGLKYLSYAVPRTRGNVNSISGGTRA